MNPATKPIPLVPVESSNVTGIGHCPERYILHVRFKSGGLYEYAGVSPEVHAKLMASESKGKHVHAHIKPAYPVRKIG